MPKEHALEGVRAGLAGAHADGGAVALLLHASDASEDGRKKLDQAWRVGMTSSRLKLTCGGSVAM